MRGPRKRRLLMGLLVGGEMVEKQVRIERGVEMGM